MIEQEQVKLARYYATAAHAAVGQLRKYTNEPYIVHPREVAEIVASVPHTPEMLCAAYLHDVVEDTGVEIVDIWREFGSVVAGYVHWLTNPSKPEDGNRAVRKRIDREYIRNAPPEVHTIKCADLISNTSTIVRYDPDFAEVYLKEKRQLLEVLTGADPVLLKRALEQVG
jgi:(p)ppGpp synthase/HD superfamily hydrolase